MKSDKNIILCINQKKSLKKYTTTQLNQYKEIANIKMDTMFINSENSKPSEP